MIYTFHHLPFYNALFLELNFTKNGCGEDNFTRPPFPVGFPLLRNLVSLTRPSLQIQDKIQTRVFPISGFLVNSLYAEIAITPEPVMILTRNLDQ